jgi:L,D-transpeptidase-like protein
MHFLAVLLAMALAGAPSPLAPDAEVDLCVPQFQLLQPAACPALGPGDYAVQLAAARMPDVVPDLPLAPLQRYDPVVPFTYARVTTPNAPLFATTADGVAGVAARDIGKGFIFVNLIEPLEDSGQAFYEIRTGEYIRAADVAEVKVTNFQGKLFTEPPHYPIAWVLNNVRPSPRPGVPAPKNGDRLVRRAILQIFDTQRVGPWDWYLIGPNQWVEQRNVARLNINPPPEGVTGRWIQVDLFEQTLVAYEGSRLVYATLISSGLNEWPTRPGLFTIYAKLVADRMRGSYRPDGTDYYFLESVPWVMYFDGARALHGEYWHDGLGYRRSHGCVNIAPQDARWLYDWAAKGTPVWVYDPSGKTPTDVDAGGAP